MKFRMKYYNDVYNVALKKRFFNSYKMDVLRDDEPIITLISNSKNGILFSENILSISYTSRYFATWENVFIEGIPEIFYRFQSFGVSRWFSNKKMVKFSNGSTFKLKVSYNYFPTEINFDFYDNDQPVCRFSSDTKQKNFRGPGDFIYEGEIDLYKEISPRDLVFLLDYIRIETAASEAVN